MAVPGETGSLRIEMPPPAPMKSEPSRRVLLISHQFPPTGGGGVQRICKMARYLPGYGWIPHVLTVQSESRPSIVDDRLLNQLPGVTHIHRAPESALRRIFRGARAAARDTGGGGRHGPSLPRRIARAALGRVRDHLLVPDEQIIWRRNAVRKALQVVQEHSIDALFSSHGPATNHLVAMQVAEQTGLPWVADFRDPWVKNLHFDALPPHRQQSERRMERRVVKRADAVTTVTRAFACSFRRRYSRERLPSVFLIYNGFDPADYYGAGAGEHDKKLTCVYAGALYPKRSPASILRAARQLIDRGEIDPGRLRLVFAGIFDYPGKSENRNLVRKLELDDVVRTVGHLPHAEAISLMRAADALLMVGDAHPRAGDYIPGKVYEYLALGKPVVGTLQQGEARDLLYRYSTALLACPNDGKKMTSHLRTLYHDWLHGTGIFEEKQRRPAVPRRYHRDYQAAQLAGIVNHLLGK